MYVRMRNVLIHMSQLCTYGAASLIGHDRKLARFIIFLGANPFVIEKGDNFLEKGCRIMDDRL